MRVLKQIFEWIFNPISKSMQVSNSDKLTKNVHKHPSIIAVAALIVTALIVLGIYYLG